MSEFRKVFSKAKHIAIITGAGVSAESGVPTFKGAEGRWRKWLSQVIKKIITNIIIYGGGVIIIDDYHLRICGCLMLNAEANDECQVIIC